MQQSESSNPLFYEIQQSYFEYAQAAERYGKRPTIHNWEEKEKAFENYNALIKNNNNK